MKILIFNSLYYPYHIGGAEVSVQLLAEGLAKKGHEVRVVTLHNQNEKEITVLNDVKIISLPLKNIYWPFDSKRKNKIKKIIWHILDIYNVRMIKSISDEIDDFHPDVVHTNNLSGFSVCVWDIVKKRNIYLVHTSRDYYLFHPNSTLFKNGKNTNPHSFSVCLWSKIKKIKSRKVDAYVGISSFIKKFHIENGFFTQSKSYMIYNSVENINRPNNIVQEIKVGFLGRLSYEKGFDNFCLLAKKQRNNNRYEFLAAGSFQDTESQSKLEKLAHESNVSLRGYLPLNDFLNEVNMVVLPIKWNEPFGRTVVECALAGKIVVTTPVGAMSELSQIINTIVIADDFERGFIEGVNILSHSKQDINVHKIFSKENITDQYIKVYKFMR